MLSQLLVLGTWTTIVGVWIDADATTRCEDACNLDILWIHKADKVFHDDIHAVPFCHLAGWDFFLLLHISEEPFL